MRNINMTSKTLLAVLGLAALAATPALAKKPIHRDVSSAYASAGTPAPIVEENRVVGTDPDPAIRSELQRDWMTSQGVD
jgi:hypothetical protein